MNELQTIKKGLPNIVQRINDIEIVDHDSAGDGTDLLALISSKWKKMEETRKEMTKPILESKRNIDAKFKKEMLPLLSLSKILKDKLLEYQQKREKFVATAKKYSMSIPGESKVKTEDATMVARKTWKYKITDMDKVPREYMQVCDQAVKQMIKDGKRDISGLEIYQETNISTRRV